jgi:hypothetical protein
VDPRDLVDHFAVEAAGACVVFFWEGDLGMKFFDEPLREIFF